MSEVINLFDEKLKRELNKSADRIAGNKVKRDRLIRDIKAREKKDRAGEAKHID